MFTPDPKYMPYTQQTQITCHNCGYRIHLATNCTVPKNPPRRRAKTHLIKNRNTSYAAQRSKEKTVEKPETFKELTHIDPTEMCAVLPQKEKTFLMFV